MGSGLTAFASGVAASAALATGLWSDRGGRRLRASAAALLAPAIPGRPATAGRRRALVAVTAVCVSVALVVFGLVAAIAAVISVAPALNLADRLVTRRRCVDVEERMPGVARALADAVAAGAALEDAVASVGGSVGGRVGRSLSLVASDCIRGLSVGQALERLCRPPAGAAWEPLATAVELHRRSGGDLPSSLRAVAESSEQLAAARASARAATAQARFTASVVCALPVVFAAGAELLRPGLIGSVVGQPIPALLASVSIVVQIACLMAIRALTAFAAG